MRQRTTLRVEHHGTFKMIGVVFPLYVDGEQVWICHHRAKRNTPHIRLNSPGGVDTVAAQWLVDNAVDLYHHYTDDTGELYEIKVPDLITNPVETQDGRRKYFPPYQAWRVVPGGLSYRAPFVTATVDLATPAPAPMPAEPTPIRPPAPTQHRLL